MTSGFCKGTVPGTPPRPSRGSLKMPKMNSKETYSVPPKGHLLVRTCEVTLRLCRGTVPGAPPSPYTRPQECPKIFQKKRTWYQTRKHVCAKARLRNPDGTLSQECCLAARWLEISDFSSKPWRNLPPIWVNNIATCRPAHNTPTADQPTTRRSTWTWCL